jgi:transcriptional regulator with XRE-family HTH domain
MPKKLPLSDQLRLAIDAAGVSRYRIAHDLGISEATLSRFMRGDRGLTLKVVDRLTEYLRLELCERKSTSDGR